jgi:FkbM family methyltransferase
MKLLQILHYAWVRTIASAIWVNESIFFYPRFRKFYKGLFPDPKSPLVILDIGANRGQSIAFFRGVFPAAVIYSFEPNARLFRLLQQKYQAHPQCFLHNEGVSREKGTLLFYENVLDETSGFEKVNPESAYLKKKSMVLMVPAQKIIRAAYEVPVTSVDEVVQRHGLSTIDILKIDVEGHEHEVLQGAAQALSAAKVKYVQLEEHADDQYDARQQQIAGLLKSAGYTEYYRQKHGFGEFYEVVYRAGFFV